MNVFYLDEMDFTIFSEKHPKNVAKFGLQRVEDPKDANFLCTRFDRLAFQAVDGTAKKILVFTHEPKYSSSCSQYIKVDGAELYFINVFTGGQFFDDFGYFAWAVNGAGFSGRQLTEQEVRERKPAVIMSRYGGALPAFVHSSDVDLCWKRTRIGLHGHKTGVVDVYGKEWPNKMAVESSGLGNQNWIQRKLSILSQYRVNFCLENTRAPFYCTEKLWHAIISGCLPVYEGSTTIFDFIPRHAIIDAAKFDTVERLTDYVNSLKTEEITFRVNAGIRALSILYDGGSFRCHQDSKRLAYLQAFLHEIMNVKDGTNTGQ